MTRSFKVPVSVDGDISTTTNVVATGQIFSNTAGQGRITLGDAAITKQSGSAFQFLSGGSFTQVVTAPTFTSNVATGTAPFTVSSTTLVTNLNADLLDGYSPATANGASTIVLRDSFGNFTANVITATTFSGSAQALTNVPAANVTGTLTSTVLGNSTHYIGTTAVALNRASANQALTGISSITLPGSTSGTLQIIPTAAAGTGTVATFPATTGTVAVIAGTLAVASGKTLTASNTLTLAGTDSTTMTFPSTSATIARTDAAQTFTGLQTLSPANAAATTAASAAGYVGMPQQSKSGAYTLVAGDAGKHIYYTVTGQTVTIPANSSVAFEIGTTITFITAPSVSLSIAITTDTLRLANTSTTGTRTLAANGIATAIKTTATTWIISGNGLT